MSNNFLRLEFGCFEKLPVTWRVFQTFQFSEFQELTLDLMFQNWYFLKQKMDFQMNTSLQL